MPVTSSNLKAQITAKSYLEWGTLAPLPDKIGFAGSFAGVANGALLVAGGANFPDGGAPWTGSTKVWHDDVFVLEDAKGSWRKAGKLPQQLGYGVSISWKDALICIGGSNKDGHHASAFIIRYKDQELEYEQLPVLPATLANSCGTVIGDVVYIAGGLKAADNENASDVFWSMDLSKKHEGWKVLATWPGKPRMLSVAGSVGSSFYLFSGTALLNGERVYLNDAFRYDPKSGWLKIADLPQAVVAAPSPAYQSENSILSIFGGDDGSLASEAAQLKANHPGFSTLVLSYNTKVDEWSVSGEVFSNITDDAVDSPNSSIWAPVTSPLVVWNGMAVLPGGEVRPATRTPNVLTARKKKINSN